MINHLNHLQKSKIALNFFILLGIILSIQSCNKKKLVYSKKTANTAEIYKLVKKGDSLNKLLQDDSAIYYFKKVQLLCSPKIDYANQYVYASSQIGIILQRAGDYYGSESVLTETFPYLKYTVRKPRLAQMVYSYTANNYYNNYDYDNALLYHKKALNIAISKFRKAQIKCDIGFIYMQQKKYQQAIDLLEPLAKKKIVDVTDLVNTDIQYAAILYNLGLSYLRLGNHEKLALENLNKSLEITLQTNNHFELIGAYHSLYLYYKKYPNPKLKKFYALNGYISACKANSVSNQINSLTEVIDSEDGKNLKKYINLYIKLTDSVSLSQKTAKNQFASIKYDSKKDKDENLELKTQKAEKELQLQRQKNTSYISYVIISAIIISLFFIVFYVTAKGKREKNNAVFKNEMRISEKLQFELEKEIDKILVFTEDNDLEKEENKEIFLSQLNNIYSKTRNISRENSKIITDENFEKALKEMISGYTSSKLNIIINGLDTFSWLKIDRVKKITVFRVLQEIFDQNKIINNASLASITFKKEEKNILITYTNNGTEFQDRSVNLNKIFVNIENRLKSVKGFLDISSNQSETFKIFIKLPL